MIKPIITRIAEGLRAFTSTRPLGQPMAKATTTLSNREIGVSLMGGLAPNAIQ